MNAIQDQIQQQAVLPEGLPVLPSTRESLPDYYASLFDGKTDYLGIRTGLDKLDKATLGLSGLVVIAATPGKGKTSLALQIAVESSLQYKTPVLFYSMEMAKRSIFSKIIGRMTETSSTDIILYGRPLLDDNYQRPEGEESHRVQELREKEKQFQKAKANMLQISDRFFVKDTSDPDLTPEAIEAEVNLLKAQNTGLTPLVVIDQLQSFPAQEDAPADAKLRIDDLIQSFRHVADSTGATIIVISQKNRSGYNSKGLDSLMGSAMIEYTADTVLLLDDAKDALGQNLNEEKQESGGVLTAKSSLDLDLHIPKQRYGSTGKIDLTFYPLTGRFSNL